MSNTLYMHPEEFHRRLISGEVVVKTESGEFKGRNGETLIINDALPTTGVYKTIDQAEARFYAEHAAKLRRLEQMDA